MANAVASTDFEWLAHHCAEICEDRKATDIRIYDVRESSLLADYYLICSAHSDPHIRAVSSNIERQLKQHKLYPLNVEGAPASHWMIIDYGGVMVHVFHPEARAYYCLEDLWPQDNIVYASEESDEESE